MKINKKSIFFRNLILIAEGTKPPIVFFFIIHIFQISSALRTKLDWNAQAASLAC